LEALAILLASFLPRRQRLRVVELSDMGSLQPGVDSRKILLLERLEAESAVALPVHGSRMDSS
jgi:hypothetical protein